MSAPKPGPRTKKTTLVLDAETVHRLKLHALEQHTDMSTIVRTLIDDYLKAAAPSKRSTPAGQKGRRA